MSELKQTIRADLKTAMKAKEKQRTSAIRALLAAIQAEETNGSRHELEDADILKVIAREIKKRRESAEVYEENGRPELAEAELADVPFFEAYQPRQLDESELQALVKESIAEVEAENGEAPTMKQMGAVMKVANAKAAGQADGKRLSAEVKAPAELERARPHWAAEPSGQAGCGYRWQSYRYPLGGCQSLPGRIRPRHRHRLCRQSSGPG